MTGGLGYIGSILVPSLLRRGYYVNVVDNAMYDQTPLMECCNSEQLSIIRGDVRDEALVKDAIKDSDFIIPLAAVVGAPACGLDPTGSVDVNYNAIKKLLKIRGEVPIIFPCTNSGYGHTETASKDPVHCTEETPLKPTTLYGKSKVAAEKAVLDTGNSVTFRFATLFGASPRMRIDLMVNDFVYRALNYKHVVLFEPHYMRNFMHVRDASRAFIFAMEHFEKMNGQCYNAGLDSANMNKIQLCEYIQKYIPEFEYHISKHGKDPDQRNYIVSNQKIRKVGFNPCYSLDDGIKELIKAYQIIQVNKFVNTW